MEIEFWIYPFRQAAIAVTHKLHKPAPSCVDVLLRHLACKSILRMQLRTCFFLITLKDQQGAVVLVRTSRGAEQREENKERPSLD